MTASSWQRRALAALIVALGVATNLASNFVMGDECDGSEPTLAIDGDAQTGVATAPLGRSLGLTITCRGKTSGTALRQDNVEVQWTVSGGGGLVDGKATVVVRTDFTGRAQVQWQLGDAIGLQTVTARAAGRSLNWQASAGGPAGGGTCSGGAGTSFSERRIVAGDERWPLAGSPYRGSEVSVTRGATLTIDPGVTVCIRALRFSGASRLHAVGEADRPIVMQPIDALGGTWVLGLGRDLDFSPTGGRIPEPTVPHRMREVRTLDLTSFVVEAQPLVLQDSQFTVRDTVDRRSTCPSISVGLPWPPQAGGASVFERVVVAGYGGDAAACRPAVTVSADGPSPAVPLPLRLRVLDARGDAMGFFGSGAGAVALIDCEIARAGRHGVVLDGSGPPVLARIGGCNITGQRGQALSVSPAPIDPWPVLDARGNWWGAPEGPPSDGVNAVPAGVDAGAPAAAPRVLGY